jgi:hypothetical protein
MQNLVDRSLGSPAPRPLDQVSAAAPARYGRPEPGRRYVEWSRRFIVADISVRSVANRHGGIAVSGAATLAGPDASSAASAPHVAEHGRLLRDVGRAVHQVSWAATSDNFFWDTRAWRRRWCIFTWPGRVRRGDESAGLAGGSDDGGGGGGGEGEPGSEQLRVEREKGRQGGPGFRAHKNLASAGASPAVPSILTLVEYRGSPGSLFSCSARNIVRGQEARGEGLNENVPRGTLRAWSCAMADNDASGATRFAEKGSFSEKSSKTSRGAPP